MQRQGNVAETKKNKAMKTEKQMKVTSNKRERTFTITTEVAKYRTLPMSREEFEDAQYNTPGDWEAYIRREECEVIQKNR